MMVVEVVYYVDGISFCFRRRMSQVQLLSSLVVFDFDHGDVAGAGAGTAGTAKGFVSSYFCFLFLVVLLLLLLFFFCFVLFALSCVQIRCVLLND